MARRRFSLAWLKPPKVPADGIMTLGEHLRELRYRFIFSAVAIILAATLCGLFYDPLYQLLLYPWSLAIADLKQSNPGIDTSVVNIGVTAPFMLAMKICGFGGLILSSPVWLYQAWAFIVPALLAKEKKLALGFIAAAVPLFIAGVFVGWWILPKGIEVMLSFTPSSVPVTNMLDINNFLDMLLQLMLVSGLAFLLPVFLVGLNLVGVVTAKGLAKARTYAIFGCFVFGAAATPSTDPFSMLALAVPMGLLYIAAELICRVNDRRRARRGLEAGLDVAL